MILAISIFALLLSAVFFVPIFTPVEKETEKKNDEKPVDSEKPKPETTDIDIYSSEFVFDQAVQKLDGEVIQYEIKFHEETRVNVDVNIGYTLETTDPVAYLVYVAYNRTDAAIFHMSDEGHGRIFDITGFQRAWTLGQGKTYTEGQTKYKRRITEAQETWYLTIAVWKSMNETIEVSIESDSKCMEVKQVSRTDDVQLYSAGDGDFNKNKLTSNGAEGRIVNKFYGAKVIPFLDLGCSIFSLLKYFNTMNAGIVCMNAWNYNNGYVRVWNEWLDANNFNPTNSTIVLPGRKKDGETQWYIEAQGLTMKRKASVLLFIVDVEPHSEGRINNNDRYPHEKWNAMENTLKMVLYTTLNGIVRLGKFAFNATVLIVSRIAVLTVAAIQMLIPAIMVIIEMVLNGLKVVIPLLVQILVVLLRIVIELCKG